MTRVKIQNKKDGWGFRALLGTLFLGAFNDNVFKVSVCLLAARIFTGAQAAQLIALAGALFILPYILVSTHAGFLADRFSKRRVIVGTKLLEVFTMSLALIAFWQGSILFIMICLFLMGLQSALFSPAKYGILPEILDEKRLAMGNGLVELFTFLAIIAGTAVAGPLMARVGDRVVLLGLFFVAVAVLGALVSLFVERVPSSGNRSEFHLNIFPDLFATVREIFRDRTMGYCAAGLITFYFLGALFQLNIIQYAAETMGLGEGKIGLLLTTAAIGIGAGSVLAGRFSRERIEYGLVPLGSLGLAAALVALFVSHNSITLTLALLFGFGMSGGIFFVPLMASIQKKSPEESRGRVLACVNLLTAVGIFSASGALYLLRNMIGLAPETIFLMSGLITAALAVAAWILLPEQFFCFVVMIVARCLYRIRVLDGEKIPKDGGALLVANHVSYIDGIFVSALTSRTIHFLAYRTMGERWPYKPFMRLSGRTIPVSLTDSPKKIAASLKTASDRIKKGELVCIFAEGALTRTANMLTFQRGLERIARKAEAPICPIYIDRLWGSVFSYERGRYFWKIPRRIPYPVTLKVGDLLPSTATAFEVRQAVAELGAEIFPDRIKTNETLLTRFITTAKSRPFAFCLVDSIRNKRRTFHQVLRDSIVLSRVLCRETKGENVGILLPQGEGAVLTTLALMMNGRVGIHLNYTAGSGFIRRAVERAEIETIITSRLFLKKLKQSPDERMIFLEDLGGKITLRDKILGAVAALLPAFLLKRFLGGRAVKTKKNLATIVFSSGSTGAPKGVQLTHQNILCNIEGFREVLDKGQKERIMGVLPFFHSFGYTAACWLPLTTGAGVIYHANPLESQKVGAMIARYRATMLISTPTFLSGYIRRCSAEQFKSLTTVLTGAEKLSARIARNFEGKFSVAVMEGYGCTELSPVVSLNVPDFDGEDLVGRHMIQKGHKKGTAGHPLPGVAVRVIHPETKELLGPGEEGLLQVKGGNVMAGYLGEPDQTKEVITNGWYTTGDIALLDKDGFITITDRLARFAKIGGEMVPLIKIEEALNESCGAEDRSFVATTVPDDQRGERIILLTTHDESIDVLIERLTNRDLPALWIPKRDAFVRVESFPLLGSGKLDLAEIKRMAERAMSANQTAAL